MAFKDKSKEKEYKERKEKFENILEKLSNSKKTLNFELEEDKKTLTFKGNMVRKKDGGVFFSGNLTSFEEIEEIEEKLLEDLEDLLEFVFKGYFSLKKEEHNGKKYIKFFPMIMKDQQKEINQKMEGNNEFYSLKVNGYNSFNKHFEKISKKHQQEESKETEYKEESKETEYKEKPKKQNNSSMQIPM